MDPGKDYILDVSKFTFQGDFDKQILEILTRVRLTRDEVENLQRLLDDLTDTLSNVWPGCLVYPFGSIITGLGIKTSDIDCFVKLDPSQHRNNKVKAVITARNVLRRKPHKFAQPFAITAAKVPIVKFLHISTNFHCDVNFASLAGVQNSELIRFLLSYDLRALHLAIIVKYWSKVYNFTGTNLMPNYALTMMVIFYLQVVSILPSVALLQRNIGCNFYVDNWNTAFSTDANFTTDNQTDMYHLLGGFFNYYKSFDYENKLISPFLGCPIKKELFMNSNTGPGEFQLYKENVYKKNCPVIRLDSSICIQDPFEHSRNCSVAVCGKLFSKIMAHFHLAATMFNEKRKDEFLKAVFTCTPALRNDIAEVPRPPFRTNNKIHKNKQHQARHKAKMNLNRWYMDTLKFNKGGG